MPSIYTAEVDAGTSDDLPLFLRDDVAGQVAYLERVLDALPHPFYVIDVATYRVVMANRTARDRGVVPGVLCHAATHGRDEPCDGVAHGCPLTQVLATGQTAVLEHVHGDQDGTRRDVEVHGEPVRDASGRIVQMIEWAIDITARRRVESELRSRNEELDAFAHTVAHDIKGPLTTLIGYAELAATRVLEPDRVRELTASVSRSGRRLARLVDALLLLSTIERVAIEIERVDLEAAVAAVLRELEHLLAEAGATVEVAGTLPAVLGHGPWVEAAVSNYVQNAIRHGGQPPRVRIEASAEGDLVRLTVRDNGPGLDPSAAARLFVPFTRLARPGVAGHGLGLSIVRRIMERLGGVCGVECEPASRGQGAAFYLGLPRAR